MQEPRKDNWSTLTFYRNGVDKSNKRGTVQNASEPMAWGIRCLNVDVMFIIHG